MQLLPSAAVPRLPGDAPAPAPRRAPASGSSSGGARLESGAAAPQRQRRDSDAWQANQLAAPVPVPGNAAGGAAPPAPYNFVGTVLTRPDA